MSFSLFDGLFFLMCVSDLKLENKTSLAFFGKNISCLGSTWMSQEVSKRLGSVGYNPNIPHL